MRVQAEFGGGQHLCLHAGEVADHLGGASAFRLMRRLGPSGLGAAEPFPALIHLRHAVEPDPAGPG